MNLSYWLKKSPKPVAVMADDKRIDVGRNRRAFLELTETIKTLDPDKVTCLDAQGNVLRSTVLDSEASAEEATAVTAEQSDLQLFARLLAEGYEHGRKASQPIVDSAMQFVERQSARLAKAESVIDQQRTHIAKLNARIAELSNAPLAPEDESSVLGTMLAAAVQSGALTSVPQSQLVKVGKK